MFNAASVAFQKSRRSSTAPSVSSPFNRAVLGISCHNPPLQPATSPYSRSSTRSPAGRSAPDVLETVVYVPQGNPVAATEQEPVIETLPRMAVFTGMMPAHR